MNIHKSTNLKLMFQPLRKYVSISGRATRKEYWLFQLLLFCVGTVLFFLSAIFALFGSLLGIYIYFAFFLCTFPPLVAVAIRRLHDINRRGWWCLILWPGVTLINMAQEIMDAGDWEIAVICYIFSFLLILWFYILMVKKGVNGDNRFGPESINSGSETKDSFPQWCWWLLAIFVTFLIWSFLTTV